AAVIPAPVLSAGDADDRPVMCSAGITRLLASFIDRNQYISICVVRVECPAGTASPASGKSPGLAATATANGHIGGVAGCYAGGPRNSGCGCARRRRATRGNPCLFT
ncbi:hypothetical protein, partial [Frankia sp. Cr2]|uniref:hypothetical protein n=1 Tax=Frankia sp. Cr2 TaxID=3073932 RepID=UPI002AD52858